MKNTVTIKRRKALNINLKIPFKIGKWMGDREMCMFDEW
jgi:hypothetical protein